MSKMQSEVQYRDVDGYPGYRAGDDGSVWSCRVPGKRRKPYISPMLSTTWRQLKPIRYRSGHLVVKLGRGCTKHVHRVVLETFKGMPPKGTECCHNDGNPANNNLSNLRWDTRKSNMADKKIHGPLRGGYRRGIQSNYKLSEEKAKAIREGIAAGHVTIDQLAAIYRVTKKAITDVLVGRTWTGKR